MSDDTDDGPTVACTLTKSEKEQREAFIRETLFDDLREIEELDRGYRFHFAMGDETVDQVAKWVRLEADCCSFATFELRVPPEADQFTLEMSGPEGFGDAVSAGILDEFREAAGA